MRKKGKRFSSNKNNRILISTIITLIVISIVICCYAVSNGKEQDSNVNAYGNNIQNRKIVNNVMTNEVVLVEIEDEGIGTIEDIPANIDNKDGNQSPTGSETYYIRVNNLANTVTIYTKDSSGFYTVPVKAMVCSTGGSTPSSGVYKIPGRRSRWRALYGNVYGQYVTNIVNAILFHSVPYLDTDPSTLEYWEYDKLGTSASMGCVRLTVADAKWIYENIPAGTQVEFYSDSNPGPLGKPSSQSISGNVECRDWDPTDYTDGNPWIYGVQTESVPNDVQPQTQQQQVQVVEQTPTPVPTPTPTPVVEPEPEIEPESEPVAVPTPTPTPEPEEEQNSESNV